ncbi:MAG: VCBS repeat-containing protein [Planctomycetes bacterium]|nr:VCBS repeat-containing protein [Planctomycetota bacterium]
MALSVGLAIQFAWTVRAVECPSLFVPPEPRLLSVAGLDGGGSFDLLLTDRRAKAVFHISRQGPRGVPVARRLLCTPRTYGVCYALGDFDEDGRFDIAAVEGQALEAASPQALGATIVVLLQRQPGAWSGSVVREYGDVIGHVGNRHLCAADFDADGHLDILVCFRRPGLPMVADLLLGDGDGSFFVVEDCLHPSVADVLAVAAADFDGDGTQDVILAGGTDPGGGADWAGVCEVHLNPTGSGVFSPAGFRTFDGKPDDIAVIDADRDGNTDAAVLLSKSPVTRSAVLILESSGSAFSRAFELPQTATGATSICTADFDSDGHLDLAVGYWDGPSIDVFRGLKIDAESPPISAASDPRVLALAAADYDRDGLPDLFAAHASYGLLDPAPSRNELTIHRNTGSRAFERVLPSAPPGVLSFTGHSFPGPGGQSTRSLGLHFVIGETDGDGALDIFAVTLNADSDSVAIFRNDGQGGFAAGPKIDLVSPAAASLFSIDIDRDGIDELIVPSGALDRIVLYTGVNKWTGYRTQEVALPSRYNWGIASSDFDRDGFGDLAISTGRGTTTFSAVEPPNGIHIYHSIGAPGRPTLEYAQRVAFPDLVAQPDYYGDRYITVHASGFFNDDPWPDLIVRGKGTDSGEEGTPLVVLLGDEDQEFRQKIELCGPCLTASASLADIDGDGMDEILTLNDDLGIAVFALGARIPAQYGPPGWALAAADFDRDGFDDVVLSTSSKVLIYRGLGDGTLVLDRQIDYADGGLRYPVHTADLNSDGWADIVLGDVIHNTITVLLNDGRLTFLRGDANGDGQLDLGDAISILNYLFVPGSGPVACEDALDTNDDGHLDLGDAVRLLNYLFAQGPAPLPPFPEKGNDPTADALRCEGGRK